jgi:hypothetical protein
MRLTTSATAIAIIDHGRIRAIDTSYNLKTSLGGDIIELELTGDGHVTCCRLFNMIRGVKRAVYVDGLLRITVENGERVLPCNTWRRF